VTAAGDLRCSVQLRGEGAGPAGSAGHYDGWALIPRPLPWPADVVAAEELAGVAEVLSAEGRAGRGHIRLQGIVPAGERRLVLHRRPPGSFAGYTRTEAAVAPGGEAEALAALLASPAASPEPARRDVLVCTHGRRDRCCGSFGTELWLALDADGTAPDVELWRTSHTGGHRFAPTMVVLPEGTMWGWLDPDVVRRILTRTGPVTDVLAHYRGCSGLGAPPLQVLESAVLAEVGWPLLDLPRRGSQTGDGRWCLEVGGEDPSTWQARVDEGRRWPVPDCGAPMGEAHKSDTELVVAGLTRTA
jgi:hypothetical protein